MTRPSFLSDQHPQFQPSAAGVPVGVGLIPPGVKLKTALDWFEKIQPAGGEYCCQLAKQKGSVQRNQIHFLDNAPAVRFVFGQATRRWSDAEIERPVGYWLWLGNPAWRMADSFRNFQKSHPVADERELACGMTLAEFVKHQISAPLHNRQAGFFNLHSCAEIDSWVAQSVRWIGLEDHADASLQALKSSLQSELDGWTLSDDSASAFKQPSQLELTHDDLEALRRHCDLDVHLYELACAKLGVASALAN